MSKTALALAALALLIWAAAAHAQNHPAPLSKKTKTILTVSPPLVSSGGAVPNISLPDVSLGSSNTAVGHSALISSTGNDNTAIGAFALLANGSHDNNTAVGSQALVNNQADDNTAVGAFALVGNGTGRFNTAVGNEALKGNQTGGANTAVGDQALFSNQTGAINTAIGSSALAQNLDGGRNVALGNDALFGNTSGSNNTAIGSDTDVSTGNLDHATVIGAGAIAPASNQVQIGRNSIDKVSIGLLGTGGATAICMSNSIFSTCASSLRYKENVEPFHAGLTLLRRLRPVTFDWKSGKEHDLGLIAEEVAAVEPLLVTHNHDGEIEGVKYNQLTVVLINALKEQQQQIERQREEDAALRARLEKLEELLRERTAAANPR